MSRSKSRSQVWPVLAILGLWVFLGQGREAVAYSSYSGSWETNENEDGQTQQQHNHLFAVDLDQSLSNVVSSRENINYNYRWLQGVGTLESVSPGASLALNADLFLATLAVNSVKNLNSQSIMADSDNVGINWSSRWQRNFMPALRFNYDYSKNNLDNAVRKIDEGRQSYGGEVDWDLKLFQTIYSYRRDESRYTLYEMNQDTQMARINADRAFINDRLRVSLGHEYNDFRNEQLIPFNSGAGVYLPVPLASSLSYNDLSPSDTDDTIVSNSDSALPFSMLPFNAADGPFCLRVRLNASQPIVRINLNTQTNLGPNPLGFGVGNWAIYANNDQLIDPANVVWTPVAGISVTYDADPSNPHFVISIPATNVYNLKIVVNNQSGSTVIFTGVQAEEIVINSTGATLVSHSKNKSNKTNFGLDFKLNRAVAFYYNYLRIKEEADATITSESENHNSGVRLQNAAGDLKTILSYSLNRNRYLASPEIQTHTYLLNINKVLLPTLSVGLGGSHEESTHSGTRVSERNRYNFYADARLYPDLTSQLEVIYWEYTNYLSSGVSNLTDDVRGQFTISSRFRPSLVVSLVEVYELQNQDAKEKINKISHALTASWQLSDWFSVNGTAQKEDNKSALAVYNYSIGVTVGFGAGLELHGNYSVQDAAVRSQSGLAALRWSYHKNFSFEIGCNYAESSAPGLQNLYKAYSRLSVNFAVY